MSVCPSVINYIQSCVFVTDGHTDLGICSYERSWHVDVPFDSFGQIRPPEKAEFGLNVKKKTTTTGFLNMSFSRLFVDGCRVLGIGSYERFWRVDVPFGSFGHTNMVETS